MSERLHSEQRANEIRKNAEDALAALSVMNRENAKLAHDALFEWLVRMNRVITEPEHLVDDNGSNTACNAFEEVILVQPGDKFKKLLDAWKDLSDSDQMNMMRFVLAKFIHQHATTGMLVSRNSEEKFWENTGFFVDDKQQAVHVKVGGNPYQPIGYTDGTVFVPNESSKSLWVRQWAMTVMFPWTPAFVIERKDIGPQTISDDTTLSDNERKRIDEVLGWFEEDLSLYARTDLKDAKLRAELFTKMREGVKLACVRVPRLEKILDQFKDQHPEVGENLEQAFTPQLVSACAEYLRMKMADDTARRRLEETTLHTPENARLKLLFTLKQGILDTLPVRPEDPVDAPRLQRRIYEATLAVPEIATLPADGELTSETAKKVLTWIDAQIAELKTAEKPEEPK